MRRGPSSGGVRSIAAEVLAVRRMAPAPAAVAVVLTSLLIGSGSADAQNDPASRALRYLAGQQLADGSIPAGFPGFGATEDTAIAAAAAGFDPSAFRAPGGLSLIDNLRNNVADASSSAARDGQLLQAVAAAHLSPRTFGGRDLVAPLQGAPFYDATTGIFGDGQAFTEALAIQGLRAAGATVPSEAIIHLERSTDADGGWNYTGVAGDPSGSDTNSTAMVLMALDAAGDHSRDRAALAFLRAQQLADAGFAFQAGPGVRSDPDSTAEVIQALVATGQDPTGCAWARGGATPYSTLVGLQNAGGGFPGYTGSVDAFTTSQVPPALLLQPFPAAGGATPGFTLGGEQSAAVAALRYLRSQESITDGSIPSAFPSYAPSENDVIAAAAAGFDPSTLRHGGGPSVVDYLRTHAAAASASAGGAGELIQAVAAARLDPRTFGGVDLVATVLAAYKPSTGAFADGQNFTQALAIQGLVAAGASVPAGAVDNLLAAENPDGGWNYRDLRGDPSGSDTNSTSMALMALAAVGHHERDLAGFGYLHTQQLGDGGFGFQGIPADPDSEALVLQALVAGFEDPAAADWSRNGHSVVDALIATQDQSGGFAYPGSPVDAFTTSQVPAALERVPFPVTFTAAGAWAAGTGLDGAPPGPVTANHLAPIGGCGVPPTPTPSVTPTSSPTPVGAPPATLHPTGDSSGRDRGRTGSSRSSGGGGSVVTPPVAPAATPVASVASSPRATSSAGGQLGSAEPLAPPAPHQGLPSWVVYVLAATAGAVIVLGGGTLLLRRQA